MESALGEGGSAIDVLGGKGCYGHGSVLCSYLGFEAKSDAVRFWAELIERMRKFSCSKRVSGESIRWQWNDQIR